MATQTQTAGESEFVRILMQMVPDDEPLHHVFEADARRMHHAGWTLQDARRMFCLHREITPYLGEEYACDEMAKLRIKYGEMTVEEFQKAKAEWRSKDPAFVVTLDEYRKDCPDYPVPTNGRLILTDGVYLMQSYLNKDHYFDCDGVTWRRALWADEHMADREILDDGSAANPYEKTDHDWHEHPEHVCSERCFYWKM